MDWSALNLENIFDYEATDRTVAAVSSFDTFEFSECPPDVFERYGAVKATRSGQVHKYAYLLIQFEDATDAVNLIRKGTMVLDGADCLVRAFYSITELTEAIQHMTFTHPTFYTPPAPEQSEQNILNVLNDDCLCEVFQRIDRLSDIISIDKVCTRFNRITQTVLNSVLKRKTVNFEELKPLHRSNRVTSTEIQQFLCRFGSSIVSVYKSNNEVIKLLNKYCPNVKSLDYAECDVLDSQTLNEIRPLLSKLRRLRIFHPLPINSIPFISACPELETLEVSTGLLNSDFTFPAIHLPKLIEFTCESGFVLLDGFLAENQQIEKLNISKRMSQMQTIAEKIPNLRKLRLSNVSSLSISDSRHLNSLKRANISIQLWRRDTGGEIENLLRIKNVTRLCCRYEDFADSKFLVELAKNLPNLQMLSLSHGEQILPKDKFTQMLQHANKLTNLYIRRPFLNYDFGDKEYDEILQIVKRRNNSLKLNIQFSITADNCKEAKTETISLNRDPKWLTIISSYTSYRNLFF